MTLIINKGISKNELMKSVYEISGVDISTCLQCKKCTNGCPVVDMVDYPPSDIIRLLQLNIGDVILKSKLVWICASCETCYSRCPMKIDMAAVMDALRIISAKKITILRNGKVKKMNRAFLNSVKMFGRTYDLGMIMSFKMKTMNFLQDLDKMPAMFKKKKIAFLPNFGGDKKQVKRIFKNIKRIKS